MASARIIETVDVLIECGFQLRSGLPVLSPDQLCFDGFEEYLDNGIIVAISLATHGHFEATMA